MNVNQLGFYCICRLNSPSKTDSYYAVKNKL